LKQQVKQHQEKDYEQKQRIKVLEKQNRESAKELEELQELKQKITQDFVVPPSARPESIPPSLPGLFVSWLWKCKRLTVSVSRVALL
jgi:hypothetical protein